MELWSTTYARERPGQPRGWNHGRKQLKAEVSSAADYVPEVKMHTKKQRGRMILRKNWFWWRRCCFWKRGGWRKAQDQLHSLVNRDNSRKVSGLSCGRESSGSLERENVNGDDSLGQL
jgi:hypothetical protein